MLVMNQIEVCYLYNWVLSCRKFWAAAVLGFWFVGMMVLVKKVKDYGITVFWQKAKENEG